MAYVFQDLSVYCHCKGFWVGLERRCLVQDFNFLLVDLKTKLGIDFVEGFKNLLNPVLCVGCHTIMIGGLEFQKGGGSHFVLGPQLTQVEVSHWFCKLC